MQVNLLFFLTFELCAIEKKTFVWFPHITMHFECANPAQHTCLSTLIETESAHKSLYLNSVTVKNSMDHTKIKDSFLDYK